MTFLTSALAKWQQSPSWLRLSSALLTGYLLMTVLHALCLLLLSLTTPKLPPPLKQHIQFESATLAELETATLRLQEKKAVAEH